MRVISKKTLRMFWEDPKRPETTRTLLASWYKTVVAATWHHFAELRQTFNSADQVGNCVVFNVGHNRYRVIGRVLYADDEKPLPGVVYVLRVMDHEEYDENRWPDQCGCHDPPPGKATAKKKKAGRRRLNQPPQRRAKQHGE